MQHTSKCIWNVWSEMKFHFMYCLTFKPHFPNLIKKTFRVTVNGAFDEDFNQLFPFSPVPYKTVWIVHLIWNAFVDVTWTFRERDVWCFISSSITLTVLKPLTNSSSCWWQNQTKPPSLLFVSSWAISTGE